MAQSDNPFYQLSENSPDAIFICAQGRFTYANPAALRLFGAASSDQLLGQSVIERVHPDHRAVAEERIRLPQERADSTPLMEARYLRLDGTPVEVEVSAVPFRYEGVDGALVFVRDVTQREQAVVELRRNQHLLQAIIDNTTAVIFVKDLEGRYLQINRRYAELFRVDNETMLGRTDRDLFGPDLADLLKAADQQVLAAGTTLEFEEVIPQDDGPHTYLSLKFPLRDAAGVPYAVCGIATDITERTCAEAEIRALNQSLEQRVSERTQELYAKKAQLREALALNENILMTSPSGFAAYRQDGQCVMANPAMADLVGCTLEQLLSQNFRQLASWQTSGLLEAAEHVLATGERVETETRVLTTFGRDIWVHARQSCFTSGGNTHLLLMFDDITDKKLAAEALAEREREFHTLADNVPDNIVRYDCQGRTLYLNRELERTLGIKASELLGKTPSENVPDGRYSALEQAVLRVGASGEAEEIEQVVPGPDGQPRYHSIRIAPEWGADGKPVSVLAVGRDLTAQKMAEEELRLAASVFHSSAEGVLVTDAAGRILSVNPAFTEITGYTASEVMGRNPSLLRSDHQRPEFYRKMWQTLLREGRWQDEIWNRKKSGEAYLEWLTINRIDDSEGKPARYVAVFHDITELRRKDAHFRHLAFHDALTGLPNRALMQDRLQHALEHATRKGTRMAVIFIDLDRFKAINDSLGHDVGDLLLQEVTRRIKARLRAMDTLARLGGDEFVVLMEGLQEPGDCAFLVQELVGEISKPMVLRGHIVAVGASIGMALFPEDGVDPVELVKRADVAMYAAKAAGRNTYRFFEASMLLSQPDVPDGPSRRDPEE